MIEEQHVSHYGSLMDPNATWLECLVMHQYTECYLYYSCMMTETDPRVKRIWEMLFEQETVHLSCAAQLLEKVEGKHYQQVIGKGDFPEPLKLCSNIDYVRGVLARTVNETALRESYVQIEELKPGVDFFRYQRQLNSDATAVPSHCCIDAYVHQFGQDYRFETQPNPIEALRIRNHDNTDVGRVPGSVKR